MAERYKCCLAVLAAGQSRRFGDQDKLAQTFRGALLGTHITQTLRSLDFARRWVILSEAGSACQPIWQDQGFDLQVNANAELGLGTSLALAAELAEMDGMDALLIALADMPLVPVDQFRKILAAGGEQGSGSIIASHDGTANMPPCLFGSDHFAQLKKAAGDKGARKLLTRALSIPGEAHLLIDIDRRDDLERASSGAARKKAPD